LIGKTPFDAEDPFAVLYKHINEPVPQPTLASDDERQLYGVIARMLAKKPDDRFQTGNELVEALGGQVSNPTLVPAVRTSVGLMAPTEMIPTPQPWYTPWWNKRSRVEQRVVLGVIIAATLVLTVVATNLVRGIGAKSAIVPNTASAQHSAVPSAGAQPITPQAAPLDSIRNADSAKALAAKTPSKSASSKRVATILAYNKLKSSCPKLDTATTAKPIEYAVRLDSIRDRVLSDNMSVSYDVCGLPSGSPFTTQFTLTKLNQHGFRQQPPHNEAAPGLAETPRFHQRWKLELKGLSSGDYQLDAVVIDGKKRQASASRKFKLSDKKQ
jgi:serine/threonine protein kinase